jgi:hypothetical protein
MFLHSAGRAEGSGAVGAAILEVFGLSKKYRGWRGRGLVLTVQGPPDAVANASLQLGQLVALDMEWTG